MEFRMWATWPSAKLKTSILSSNSTLLNLHKTFKQLDLIHTLGLLYQIWWKMASLKSIWYRFNPKQTLSPSSDKFRSKSIIFVVNTKNSTSKSNFWSKYDKICFNEILLLTFTNYLIILSQSWVFRLVKVSFNLKRGQKKWV